MKNYMKDYIKSIDGMLSNKKINNIDFIIENHLVKIKFFQHERLIHFLVTMLFAIMFLISFLYSLNNFSVGLLLLDIMFVLLLVPYIFHYYYLENSVQYMYIQYDKLIDLKKSN